MLEDILSQSEDYLRRGRYIEIYTSDLVQDVQIMYDLWVCVDLEVEPISNVVKKCMDTVEDIYQSLDKHRCLLQHMICVKENNIANNYSAFLRDLINIEGQGDSREDYYFSYLAYYYGDHLHDINTAVNTVLSRLCYLKYNPSNCRESISEERFEWIRTTLLDFLDNGSFLVDLINVYRVIVCRLLRIFKLHSLHVNWESIEHYYLRQKKLTRRLFHCLLREDYIPVDWMVPAIRRSTSIL